MKKDLYSLRMRAVRFGKHLSGAERIGRADDIPTMTAALTERALRHGCGLPDQVFATVERLDPADILHAQLPDVTSWAVTDWQAGRLLAASLLAAAGVNEAAARQSLVWLAEGPAPDCGPMRGAMLVDSQSGQRLEPDTYRGVRVSRMDVSPDERPAVEQFLDAAGLGHHRVLEAMVLSAKVLSAPGIVAELCWSDEPDYLTGYVAAPGLGYQRITPLKEAGASAGGRAFFVNSRSWDRDELIDFLEQTAVLLHGRPVIHPSRSWSA
jgi:6-carboxyhexanoate--CoA ligase